MTRRHLFSSLIGLANLNSVETAKAGRSFTYEELIAAGQRCNCAGRKSRPGQGHLPDCPRSKWFKNIIGKEIPPSKLMASDLPVYGMPVYGRIIKITTLPL